jgi:hypothetical protein
MPSFVKFRRPPGLLLLWSLLSVCGSAGYALRAMESNRGSFHE